MTSFHIIVANHRTVYVWQYRTQVSKLTSGEGEGGGGGGGGGGGVGGGGGGDGNVEEKYRQGEDDGY